MSRNLRTLARLIQVIKDDYKLVELKDDSKLHELKGDRKLQTYSQLGKGNRTPVCKQD